MQGYSRLRSVYKRVLLISACLFVLLKSNSQENKPDVLFSDTGFIFNVVPELRNREKIILVNKLHPGTIQEISSHLENDSLFVAIITTGDLARRDTILLTEEEKKTIKKRVRLFPKEKWQKEFPTNVQIINRDTINRIFSDKNRGWKYYHAVYGDRFYSFSKPIFLKERNLCIFYYDYACGGLCGYGLLAIYRKEGTEWKLFYSISQWVS
jgi:hypothetical protein